MKNSTLFNVGATPALQVQQVSCRYQGQNVLHDINLTLKAGTVTALVGPNGCGKSTLLRCMAGLQPLTHGQIRIKGTDIQDLGAKQLAQQLAWLPQSPEAPPGISVAGLVRLGRHPHQSWWQQYSAKDEQAIAAAMQTAAVTDLAHKPLDQLSGGQRQRSWLALALAQETPILLLDEPTSMLDLGHQVDILQGLRQLAHGADGQAPRAVVLVLHDLAAAARYADTLVAMRAGRILACGEPRQIVTPALMQQLYDVAVDVLNAPGDGAPVVVPKAGVTHAQAA